MRIPKGYINKQTNNLKKISIINSILSISGKIYACRDPASVFRRIQT